MTSTSTSMQRNNRRYQILRETYDSISEIVIPGVEAYIETNSLIKQWLETTRDKLDETTNETNLAELEELAATYYKGYRRACEVYAAEIWKSRPPADELDLRVLRHLSIKLTFKLDDGEYYLFGKTPSPLPGEGVRWATAQDWLDVVSNDVAIVTVQTFGTLPLNNKYIPLKEAPMLLAQPDVPALASPQITFAGVS